MDPSFRWGDTEWVGKGGGHEKAAPYSALVIT